MTVDPSFLQAALIGYQNQLAEIDQAIADLRRRLKIASPGEIPAAKPRKQMSTAARRRIAAAQRKRWAAYRKSKHSK